MVNEKIFPTVHVFTTPIIWLLSAPKRSNFLPIHSYLYSADYLIHNLHPTELQNNLFGKKATVIHQQNLPAKNLILVPRHLSGKKIFCSFPMLQLTSSEHALSLVMSDVDWRHCYISWATHIYVRVINVVCEIIQWMCMIWLLLLCHVWNGQIFITSNLLCQSLAGE